MMMAEDGKDGKEGRVCRVVLAMLCLCSVAGAASYAYGRYYPLVDDAGKEQVAEEVVIAGLRETVLRAQQWLRAVDTTAGMAVRSDGVAPVETDEEKDSRAADLDVLRHLAELEESQTHTGNIHAAMGSMAPSMTPSIAPSMSPSMSPSVAPTLTMAPTLSKAPSTSPTASPSMSPSMSPSYSLAPTDTTKKDDDDDDNDDGFARQLEDPIFLGITVVVGLLAIAVVASLFIYCGKSHGSREETLQEWAQSRAPGAHESALVSRYGGAHQPGQMLATGAVYRDDRVSGGGGGRGRRGSGGRSRNTSQPRSGGTAVVRANGRSYELTT